MLGTIFSCGGEEEREREEALKRKKNNIYIYIYINMCTANLRTKTYEGKQCVISSQKKKKTVCHIKTERELHFLTWAAYILRLRDKLYN